jgi:CheY-like chemotaxis protein
MKIEVCCPSCEQGYLLEDDMSGGEFACPYCSTKINLEPKQEPTRASVQPTAAQTPVVAAPAELIVCPRCELHFKPRADQPKRVAPKARSRVLIVEQEGFFKQVAEEALADEYTVITATTVEDARAILSRGDITLLILDLDLEGGGEGRLLLPGRENKTCPILLFTAEHESETYGEEWDELHRLGADDLVIKGINAAESLKRKVDAILGRTIDEDKCLR